MGERAIVQPTRDDPKDRDAFRLSEDQLKAAVIRARKGKYDISDYCLPLGDEVAWNEEKQEWQIDGKSWEEHRCTVWKDWTVPCFESFTTIGLGETGGVLSERQILWLALVNMKNEARGVQKDFFTDRLPSMVRRCGSHAVTRVLDWMVSAWTIIQIPVLGLDGKSEMGKPVAYDSDPAA